MGHIDSFIIDLARILIIAGVITVIFRKIKLPAILGYILAGFLASPNFIPLKVSVSTSDVQLWADIGIIFLMFALGLEFSFKKIARIGGSAVITAMTVMGAMIAIGYITGILLGWDHMDSIFLGGMLSMSSTMIIMKVYQEYRMEKERFASIVMGTLVIEDLGGVFMMIILSTMAVGEATQGGAVVLEIAKLLGFLVVWLAVGIFIIPTLLKKISKIVNDELLLIISLALCFAMVLIGTRIGFSTALGAFLSGSIIAGTVHASRIDKLVKPLKDLFGAIFFVSVGTMLDPEMVVKYIGPIIIITLGTIFGQMIFSTLGMLLSGQTLHTAMRGGFSMVQIGEFSFIVASLGTSLGVTGDYLYPIVVCVSVITSFATPFFIRSSEHVFGFVDRRLPGRIRGLLNRYTSSQRSRSETDSDWHNYLIKYFQRVVFCTAGLAAFYFAGTGLLEPFVDKYINSDWSHIIAAAVTCAAMIPVIAVLCVRRHILYTKLWLKARSNRLPLITMAAVKFIIAIMAIMITLRKLLHLQYPVIAAIVLIIMVFVVKTDFARSAAIRVEMQFVGNLNEELLARQKREHKVNDRPGWLDQKMYVVEFRIKETVENNNIVAFGNNRFYHVTIIKIIRDGKQIVMPGPTEKILKGDELHALGSREEIDTCLLQLERESYTERPEEEPVSLRDYIYSQIFREVPPEDQLFCIPVNVEKDSVMNKKPIKNSQFRQRYKGYIIGIERDERDIVNPDINTIIREDDILWAVGSRRMGDSLLKAGLWDHETRNDIRRKIKENR